VNLGGIRSWGWGKTKRGFWGRGLGKKSRKKVRPIHKDEFNRKKTQGTGTRDKKCNGARMRSGWVGRLHGTKKNYKNEEKLVSTGKRTRESCLLKKKRGPAEAGSKR